MRCSSHHPSRVPNFKAGATLIWQCLFCILPTETVLARYHVNFSGSGPDFGPRDLSQRLGNSRAMLVGRFSRPGDHSRPISGHFSDFGPDPLSETWTSALSQQQTSVLSQQQTSVLSTADICPVSTEDIYPVSTEDGTAGGRRPAAGKSYVATG